MKPYYVEPFPLSAEDINQNGVTHQFVPGYENRPLLERMVKCSCALGWADRFIRNDSLKLEFVNDIRKTEDGLVSCWSDRTDPSIVAKVLNEKMEKFGLI